MQGLEQAVLQVLNIQNCERFQVQESNNKSIKWNVSVLDGGLMIDGTINIVLNGKQGVITYSKYNKANKKLRVSQVVRCTINKPIIY